MAEGHGDILQAIHHCKPFTKAEIKYFDLNDIDEAYAWIRAGLEETAIS